MHIGFPLLYHAHELSHQLRSNSDGGDWGWKYYLNDHYAHSRYDPDFSTQVHIKVKC
jgi:hypothetical protein